jgi:plasmid maintenance system antidote protein VapI
VPKKIDRGRLKKKQTNRAPDHSGSTFDSFLEKEGIREESEAVAVKRILVWQLWQAMKQQKKTKQAMARALHTSRSQLDRLLDPQNTAVTINTAARAARLLKKRLVLRLAERVANEINGRAAKMTPKARAKADSETAKIATQVRRRTL